MKTENPLFKGDKELKDFMIRKAGKVEYEWFQQTRQKFGWPSGLLFDFMIYLLRRRQHRGLINMDNDIPGFLTSRRKENQAIKA